REVKAAQQYLKIEKGKSSDIRFGGYGYVNYLQMAGKKDESVMRNPAGGITWYCLMSPGTDYKLDYDATKTPHTYLIYDPTNGTTSSGDVYVFGP
ncbi:MAG: hypothetical protein QME64_04755, partial [bacterium]|nr:hypothetical protein [bacterium]